MHENCPAKREGETLVARESDLGDALRCTYTLGAFDTPLRPELVTGDTGDCHAYRRPGEIVVPAVELHGRSVLQARCVYDLPTVSLSTLGPAVGRLTPRTTGGHIGYVTLTGPRGPVEISDTMTKSVVQEIPVATGDEIEYRGAKVVPEAEAGDQSRRGYRAQLEGQFESAAREGLTRAARENLPGPLMQEDPTIVRRVVDSQLASPSKITWSQSPTASGTGLLVELVVFGIAQTVAGRDLRPYRDVHTETGCAPVFEVRKPVPGYEDPTDPAYTDYIIRYLLAQAITTVTCVYQPPFRDDPISRTVTAVGECPPPRWDPLRPARETVTRTVVGQVEQTTCIYTTPPVPGEPPTLGRPRVPAVPPSTRTVTVPGGESCPPVRAGETVTSAVSSVSGQVTDCVYARPRTPGTPGTGGTPGTPGTAAVIRTATLPGTSCEPGKRAGEVVVSGSVTRTSRPDRESPFSGIFCYYRHPGAPRVPPRTVAANHGSAVVPWEGTRLAWDRMARMPLFAASGAAGTWTADWLIPGGSPVPAGAGNIDPTATRLERFAAPVWQVRADDDSAAAPVYRTGIAAAVQYAPSSDRYTRGAITVLATADGATSRVGAITRDAATVLIPVPTPSDRLAAWTVTYRDGAAADAAGAAGLPVLAEFTLGPAPDSLPAIP